MERDQDKQELVELGIASIETRGQPIGSTPEPRGLYFVGLSDE
jgi:hypothetical protein